MKHPELNVRDGSEQIIIFFLIIPVADDDCTPEKAGRSLALTEDSACGPRVAFG